MDGLRPFDMDLSPPRVRVLNTRFAEDAYEDVPPVLPPLQGSSAGGALLSRIRPSPLEPRPNNRINIQPQSTIVSNRQRALADAKPLENGDSELDASLLDLSGGVEDSRPRTHIPTAPDPEQARKKAKLRHNEQIADFVHLPTPQCTKSHTKENRLPPLRPIAELNEPPSGAARFPPITPRGNSQVNSSRHSPNHLQPLPKLLPKEASKDHPQKPTRRSPLQAKKRRIYTRERTKWTEGETEQLVQGLAIYGMGRWKHILDHPEFSFHPSRTHVDLKDRFRVLFPPNEPHKWVRPMPEHISDEEHVGPNSKGQGEKPRLRKRKQAWTEREDEELDKGFQKHGYQWGRIAKDESLNFNNRSGSNIRDRFRLKYPEKWSEPRPPQLGTGVAREVQGVTKGAGSRGGKAQRKDEKRRDGVGTDGLLQQPIGEDHKVAGDTIARPNMRNLSQMQGPGQDWLIDLLNEDWEAPTGGIAPSLPPIRWEEMALQTPIFDIG